MSSIMKPKRALLAYCALADRIHQSNAGMFGALVPFFAPICRDFAGRMFDAAAFSDAVANLYGMRIPRLAVLGMAEQLSDIAFASMAAEALACFSEPAVDKKDLSGLEIYLDSPLLLDVLGVNVDYSVYGTELLAMVSSSGAQPSTFEASGSARFLSCATSAWFCPSTAIAAVSTFFAWAESSS